MTSSTTMADLREVGTFAERLIGEPLWRHQLEIARSPARFRMVLSGRRAGKTRLLAVCALHWAFTRREQYVLVMSHGEDGAKDLLGEISALAGSALLSASVQDDEKTLITLSNGSQIRCVPASQKRVRGKGADLLIIDEACFVDEELWNAAKYTILANPGSRVILSSTPYGRRDKFFARYYALGRSARGEDRLMYESFHAPSSVSPLVDRALLKEWRKTDPPRIYRREVLAEWVDEAGQYFTSAELDAVEAEYQLTPPEEADGDLVVGGIDWGFSHDSSALALLGVLDDEQLNDEAVGDEAVWFFPWIDEQPGMPYAQFIDRVVAAGSYDNGGAWHYRPGYCFRHLISEANGVGAMPTQELRRRLREAGYQLKSPRRMGFVADVHTTARRKEAAFGTMKLLFQQGRLLLPKHTALRRQLEGLEFETLDSGLTKISVPENAGHDDVAMAAAQAVSCIRLRSMGRAAREWRTREGSTGEVLTTGSGTRIREHPRSLYATHMLRSPRGGDDSDDW